MNSKKQLKINFQQFFKKIERNIGKKQDRMQCQPKEDDQTVFCSCQDNIIVRSLANI